MTNKERRLFLQSLLKELPDTKSVYFQPPANVRLVYPAIVYRWSGDSDLYADDQIYKSERKYTLTIIDTNPDSVIPDIFKRNFAKCRFDTSYTRDGLHHWVYTLYW